MDGKQRKLIQNDVASVAGHTFISLRKDAECAMAELGLVLHDIRGDDWVNFN